jgi:putative SOS response-associated peptidase YedK
MCGRYVTVSSVKTVEKRFNVHAPEHVVKAWRPNTNVSHGEAAPVVASNAPDHVQLFQFGFTPHWAKKQFYTVNARSEGDNNKANEPHYGGTMGILQKPMFRRSFRERRCLVVADAFIEGPEKERLGRPYVVYPRDGERPFSLAGIWDEWTDPGTGEIVRSFAIITTVPNKVTQAIDHHRSPVLLDSEQEREWIDAETPLSDITAMLRPCPANRLNAYPISTAIRDPRANGSELLAPIGERIFPEHTYEIHEHLSLFGMGESRARNTRDHYGASPQARLF